MKESAYMMSPDAVGLLILYRRFRFWEVGMMREDRKLRHVLFSLPGDLMVHMTNSPYGTAVLRQNRRFSI